MNINRLFKKKSIHEVQSSNEAESQGLKRSLGSFQLTSIGLGAIIGAGIFVVIGPAAALYAGPGIALSYIIAAIICVLAGLCYAELSSLIPVAGSVYAYSYIGMGEFPAWVVGWTLIAQFLFSLSTVAVGWSGYALSILHDFGLSIPSWISQATLQYTAEGGWGWTGSLFNFPAVLLILLIGALVSSGIKAAATLNNVMVVIKMTTIVLFIVLGLSFVKTSNWVPFIPENTGVFGEFGWSGIFRAAGLLFFAFIGFDSVSSMAQEAINPQKSLPRGILGSLGISTLAYIIISLVLTGIVSYQLLNVPDPMSVALDVMGSGFAWLKWVIKFAILAALTSVVLVQLLSVARVIMAISKDGLLSQKLGQIHKKTQTPFCASVTATLLCVLIAGVFPVNILTAFVSMNNLFIYAIVCLGVLVLRYLHPELNRPFKVPCVPLIPVLGILSCLGQMIFFPAATWIQFACWFGLGLFVYSLYGIKHSKLSKSSPNSH